MVTLTGGIYNLERLQMAQQSRLECQAPCEVRVKRRLQTGPGSFVGPASAVLTPTDVELFVEGGDEYPEHLHSGAPAATFGVRNHVEARMMVPNGTLRFKLGTEARGVFFARDVQVGADVHVIRDGL